MTNSNKTYVSPGVYTSERDLTFVAQSIGVTTLGLVGETIKGPANEPILITNFDEFKAYFGGTTPVKDGDGNPKYELPYFAKSYLEQSNQMFVTRVLGLTGYKANKTFGIQALGGVNYDVDTYTSTGSTLSPSNTITGSTFYSDLSGKTSVDGTTVTDYIKTNFSGLTASDDNKWFSIGLIPSTDFNALTGAEMSTPLNGNTNNNANIGKDWYNTYFVRSGSTDATINGVYSYLFVWSSGTTTFNVTRYKYSASLNTDYHNTIVAALRSRGNYVNNSLVYSVTANSGLTMSSSTVSYNPLNDFALQINGKSFNCSLETSSKNYLTKVFGTEVFEKNSTDYPVYVHESYVNLLNAAFKQGYIRGLSTTVIYKDETDNFMREWDTASSPMVVSEVRGNKVDDLFQVIAISDGDSANMQIKITIQNIDLDKGEFDLIVRDFNDTDDNIVVLESFSRCSMNPDVNGYIAKKVGTSDGEYTLRSKYIMLQMVTDHPTDAIPSGFKGFVSASTSTSKLGNVMYKTEYYDAGDIISYNSDGTPNFTSGDKVRKVSLGLSNQIGYDKDLFKFKGKNSSGETFGFHLSKNAESITGTTYQTTPYDLEGVDKGKLSVNSSRKYTFAVCGGFDGWDIYRKTRTFGDSYVLGKSTYTANNTNNGGLFSITSPNSDYYAYIKGIDTFSNPKAIDINVFSTAGINFFDHSSLTSYAIDMIENERADSVYIISAPSFLGDTEQVVDALDTIGLDTNYSATYWPWIKIRDTDNSTQLFIPPTGEVLKNIAYTDSVSYPWFAVAGFSRGLVNAERAQTKLSLDDINSLYLSRINPIATFTDTGTIIWGNKTLQVRESSLDRLNVRRLLLRARKLISTVAIRLLFEQDDEQVRNDFLRLVNPILDSIKKERGLVEFKVVLSNDPEDIDANTLRGKIYIKPTRSLEIVDLEFVLSPTGASFDNI
jgi:hypothetical protein